MKIVFDTRIREKIQITKKHDIPTKQMGVKTNEVPFFTQKL